jgi:hypothetical protein
MHDVTELARGHITTADELSIQLIEPADSPSVIMIVWPAKATPARPDAYADCAAKIMRVVARASIELAAIKAKRPKHL